MLQRSFLILTILLFSCVKPQDENELKTTLHELLDNWHQAASDADFNSYFNSMATESVFIGTDKSEKWRKQEFMDFAKPYFDRGQAWEFKVKEREIYLSVENNVAWFDEQLDTWMGVCQASGVLRRNVSGEWKIAHYQLSMSIDNELVREVIKLHETKKEAAQ